MPHTMPLRADHRYVVQMLNSVFADERLAPRPDEVEIICEVFAKAGGSWERLFRGSVEDTDTLRRVARAAIQRGEVTRRPSWD